MAYLAYKSAASKESAGQDCSNARHRLTVLRALFPDKAIRSQLRDNGPAFEDFEWAKVKRLLFLLLLDANCVTVVPQQVDLFVGCECADTPRWVLCGAATLSGISNEENLKSAPHEPGWP